MPGRCPICGSERIGVARYCHDCGHDYGAPPPRATEPGPGSPAPGPPPSDAHRPPAQRRVSAEEKEEILAQGIANRVARGNHRVEMHTDTYAILVEGQPVNHTLHLLLTIFTCALWGIVWIVMAAQGGEKRWRLWVDDYGNGHTERLA